MSLPFTTNRFLPINVKGSDAITGTYGGVSILNNGKAELKEDTTIKRLGINGNTNPVFDLNVSGTANITTLVQTPRITYTNGVSAKLLTTQSSAITVTSGVMSFTATNPEATFQSFKTQFYGSPFTITSVEWASIANMPINGVWTFYIQNITSGDIIIKNNIISSGTAGTYLHTDYPADITIPNTYGIAVIKIERGETVEAYLTAYITSNAVGGVIPNPYVLPLDATFDLITLVDGLTANVGSTVNINGTLNVGSGTTTIGGYLDVGSSSNLANNITNIFGEGFKYNDGIGSGLFMVGANNFFIDMDNNIAQTSIGEYDLYADLVKVETFDFNINNGLDVGVTRMGNDYVFDCVNHVYTDNSLTRNIPNATTTTKTIIATNNVRSTRISVDGKCQIEDLTKVYYTTATNYNIQWGDENTIMVTSTVAQNIYLPIIPADDTKDGVTFRILKATNVSVYLMVGDGSAFETENNTSVTSYQMVGSNRFLFVTVGYNSANNRIWRIVQSQASGGSNDLLTSNNTWSGTNLFNADVTVSTGRFIPVFPLNNTCYRIGTNTLPNSTALTADCIAFGSNAMQGVVAGGTYDSKFIRCIAIGNNAMRFSLNGTSNTPTEDNVALGYNAMLNCSYNCYRNVVIGSKACGSGTYQGLSDSVVIGALIGSTTSAYYTNSVIIGSSNLKGSGANDATIIGYGNFLNTTFTYANGATILGSSNLANAVQFNRMICIGSSSLTNLNNNLSVICIGTQSLAGLTTAGYVVGIGSFIGTGNSSLSNTTIIGTNSNTSLNSVCYFGGNDGGGSPTFQDLLPANKNRLLTNQSIATNTTLAFETGEHVNITSSSVTTVTLPSSVLARNIGARFTLFKNYTGAVSVTISSGTNGIRLADNSVSNTYTWASAEQYITLVCVATTSPMWAVVNSAGGSTAGLQTQITELDGRMDTAETNITSLDGRMDTAEPQIAYVLQRTQGIEYDNLSGTTNISNINTNLLTSPDLVIGFGGTSNTVTTINGYLSIEGAQYINKTMALAGSPNVLTKPLSQYYFLTTNVPGDLTLPAIDYTMLGCEILFTKISTESTWTINASSGNFFRLYKSNSTATTTSISLALNNTVLRLAVSQANVWDVVETDIFATPSNWVVATKYCPYKTFPTTISVATNWDTAAPAEFCKYVLFSNSGTGSITLTLPQIQTAAVFEGMEFVFRRTNTAPTASTTSVLAVQRGGTTDLMYIGGAMTTAINTNVLASGAFYGKIVCVSKTAGAGRWAYFPS